MYMSRALSLSVNPGASEQDPGYKINDNALRRFGWVKDRYEKTAFDDIVRKLEGCDTMFPSATELELFLKQCGIRSLEHLRTFVLACKPVRKAKRSTSTAEEMSVASSLVQTEVSKITQGGNCNEHADTATGFLMNYLDEIEDELGVQYVSRAGLVNLDHEFLLLSPKPIRAFKQQKNLLGKLGRSMPNGTVCIDPWPTIGQALLWEDTWGKNRKASTNSRWTMSTTELKQLKARFESAPQGFGVNRNWKKEIKSRQKITAAIASANSSMRDGLAGFNRRLKKLEESCTEKKVKGMYRCRRGHECAKVGNCDSRFFDQFYHFWSNDTTPAVNYYITNRVGAGKFWKKEWQEMNALLGNILKLTVTGG